MLSNASILIVEDEWLIAMETQAVLRNKGFKIVGPASSVARALDLIRTSPIDAALLDVQLDGETSLAVAEALFARKIPFGFLSGLSSARLPKTMEVVPFIHKPGSLRKILDTVEKLLLTAYPSGQQA